MLSRNEAFYHLFTFTSDVSLYNSLLYSGRSNRPLKITSIPTGSALETSEELRTGAERVLKLRTERRKP